MHMAKKKKFTKIMAGLVNAYAPNNPGSREELWQDLLLLKSSLNIPWCFGGDFNEIKTNSERVGCTRVERNMRHFIDQAELIDLPMMGRQFTWTNFQDNAIHSRLDRFLISMEWLEKFKVVQWGRPNSDHYL